MANRYWVGGTANWDGAAGTKWATTSGGAGGAAVPTSSDDVFFDAASGAVTVTKSASGDCLSLNFTGYTGTFTLGANLSMYGSLTLVAAMTLTRTGGSLFFKNTTSQTITTNGKAIPIAVDLQMNGGTLTFQDDVVLTGTGGPGQWLHEQGTVTMNNFNLTCSGFYCSGSSTRAFNMGSGTLTITGSDNDGFFDMSSTSGLTLNAGTSTIKATDSSSTLKTFKGGGSTFYNLWVATGSTGLFTITGANTFNNLRADAGRTIQFPSVTTQTVASVTFIGTAGNEITLKSSGVGGAILTSTEISAGSGYSNFDTVTLVGGNNDATFTYVFGSWNATAPGTGYTAGVTYNVTGGSGTGAQFRADTVSGAPTWTISDTTGTNAVEYCLIENSTASGGATWNAFTSLGNVDNGGNTGWNFTAPPSGNSSNFFF